MIGRTRQIWLNATNPPDDLISGEERNSVTDTDLFTADASTDSNEVPNAVTPDTSDVETKAPVGSLSTMVLPELRALANQVGVKGTSGMRTNEPIAAIKEIRGQSNGTSAPAAPEDSGKSDVASADAPAAEDHQNGSTTEAAPRERRSASREPQSARTGDEARGERPRNRENSTTGEDDTRQGGKRDTRATSAVETPVATKAVISKARAAAISWRRRRRGPSGQAWPPLPRSRSQAPR